MSFDADNLYGWALIQMLSLNEIVQFKDILNTEVDFDIGYILEVDLKCPYALKRETKHFSFCPDNRVSPLDIFSD